MGTDSALFVKCKWTNRKIDLDVLESIVSHSHLFHCKHKYFYFFAKTEFMKGCIDKASEMSMLHFLPISNGGNHSIDYNRLP